MVSAHSRAICSGCARCRLGYDRLAPRRFEFIPLWGLKVCFLWVSGKRSLTESTAWFLAAWAKRLSWNEVARVFRTTWAQVFSSVEMAVSWGRAHQNLEGIEAIGVDEMAWQRGRRYLTLVYQIDAGCRRLLRQVQHRGCGLARRRKARTLLRFFGWLGRERTQELRYVCSELWKPYLKVIAKKAGHALHILERFHIMAQLGKAIAQVRAKEARKLKCEGYAPILSATRWLFLKRPEHLTAKQALKLAGLLRYNLKAVRSILLKEELQRFWHYQSWYWAGKFLDGWSTKTMRSKIEPMKKVAGQLRRHRPLLLNWFRAKGQFSSGVVEGFNNKAKLTTRKAYGFRMYRATEIALYHAPGNLPTPKAALKFF